MKDARLQKEKCRFYIRKSVLFYEKTYAFLKSFCFPYFLGMFTVVLKLDKITQQYLYASPPDKA